MDTSIINLNQTEIDSLNNSYKEIFNENYLSDADVSKLITKRISTLEYEVESLMNNKDYDSAIAIADKLIKHDKSKERATNTITEINTIRREIIKESINTAIDSNDVDTAKELLTKLSEIGGGDEFINSKSTIIQRIEDDAKIRSIFTDVNSLLRESNYTDAKSKVYELRELGYTEDQITSTISKVENHEKAYLKDMADREAKAYKEDALNVTYASILRDPDKYIGKVITVRGEIVEVQNDIYRLSTKYNMGLGYFGNDIIFDYKQKGIIRGDVVRIYGVLKEIKDHAIIGALPVFSSEVVDIEIKLF